MLRATQQSSRSIKHSGFSYIELLLAVAIGTILMGALIGVVYTASESQDDVEQRNKLTSDARFAMNRMLDMLGRSDHLMLPLRDNPDTNWPEHIREQTRPPSPPIGSSTLATAVLAFALPKDIDANNDGFPDADNDKDGKIDEDLPTDNNNDGEDGILGIDDDGDGSVDESTVNDNDEQGGELDDLINGLDDDGDGSIDEDVGGDMNGDGEDGIIGVDDDGDFSIDEPAGSAIDDDEDEKVGEDWYDSVVYFMQGDDLVERMPVARDVNNDSVIDGKDFIESDLADDVIRFRIERIDNPSLRRQLVDIQLDLINRDTGEVLQLHSRVRVGAEL
ncbi:MAG: hypothetical protein QNJ69_09425 [Gammaproteobacteria bacterium]|nr:hypothetical protein [Gammaproteobacteria bacterium]